jgi:hypothetical protein
LFFFLPASVKETRLRLTPQTLQLGSAYVDAQSETQRFVEIIELPVDSVVVPILRLDNRLQTNTNMTFEPLSSLTGLFAFSQGRELAPTGYLVQGQAARQLINSQRSTIAGLDLGWVTGQNLTMNWTWRPVVANWLNPLASFDSRYRFNRGASFVTEQRGDTVLTGDFDNARNVRASVGFNLPVFLRSTFGSPRSAGVGALYNFFDRFDIFNVTWTGTLSSNFERQTANPTLGYEMGLGGFESHRIQSGDTASRVTDSEAMSLSSGFRFPFGIGLNVDYGTNDLLIWTQISQSRNRSTQWPAFNLNWSRIPLPPAISRWVSAFGMRAGYNLRKTRSDIFSADQTRISETKSIPVSVNIAFTTEWSANYTLNLSDEERFDPTGTTIGKNTNHAFQLNGRLRPLTSQGSFQHPIRISLRLAQDNQEQCRSLGNPFLEGSVLPEAQASCEPFTDLRIRRIDLTVGTDLPPFVLGLQGSWRDTQSRIGQLAGNTQLEIILFGQFLIETGEIR